MKNYTKEQVISLLSGILAIATIKPNLLDDIPANSYTHRATLLLDKFDSLDRPSSLYKVLTELTDI